MKFVSFMYDEGGGKPPISTAYFDGYSVGDRLLEGVVFKAEIKDSELLVSFYDSKDKYLESLNVKKWLKEAQEFAETNDVFNDNANLDGEDVYLETIDD